MFHPKASLNQRLAKRAAFLLGVTLLSTALISCVALPTVEQVARERQYGMNHGEPASTMSSYARWRHRNDLSVYYSIADVDVLNWVDRVKVILAKHCNGATVLRYGSATTQDVLTSLAGAASTAGWATSTASGLGAGATFLSTLGRTYDTKAHAQAYEQAFAKVQAAEATYYFYQLGMRFDDSGKVVVTNTAGRAGVPSQTNYTPDGETLYYTVSKVVKVLEDTLASKIPDLQDLKDANGDTKGTGTPAKPAVFNSATGRG